MKVTIQDLVSAVSFTGLLNIHRRKQYPGYHGSYYMVRENLQDVPRKIRRKNKVKLPRRVIKQQIIQASSYHLASQQI